MFLGDDFTGDTFKIPAGTTVLLDNVPYPGVSNANKKNWNDKVLSAIIAIDRAGSNADNTLGRKAVVYKVSNIENMYPIPTCAILYGSNPITHQHTTGIIACSGSAMDSTVFTSSELKELQIILKDYSNGISYVRVGSEATVTLYTGHDPQHSLHSLVIPAGSNTDLTKVHIKEETGYNKLFWDDYTISFAIGQA